MSSSLHGCSPRSVSGNTAPIVRRIGLHVLVLLFFANQAEAGHLKTQAGPHPDPRDRVVPGIVIIKVREGLQKGTGLSATLSARLSSRGVQRVQPVFQLLPSLARTGAAHDAVAGLSRMFYGFIAPDDDPRAAAARIGSLHSVEYAEPKYLQTLSEAPNDPMYALRQSVYLAPLRVEDAWAIVKVDGAVTIADVDGGTYWRHQDLLPNLWINSAEDINHNGKFDPGPPPAGDEDGIDQDGDGFIDDVIGWNFATSKNDPQGLVSTPGSASHGTATASHYGAATNNGIGMAGTSWNCKVMPINTASATVDDAIEFGYEGIMFAASHGARVINCSWGRAGTFSQFEQDVASAATQSGALIVASAGNDFQSNNDAFPTYPASFRQVLTVGATYGPGDVVADFSNIGLSVEVYAPGVNIWSALTDGTYGNGGSGTSYSSPLTAGLAGLLFSQHPTWTPRQVATQIRVTADPIDAQNPSIQGNVGHGRVNFYRAVTESKPGLEVESTSIAVSTGKSYIVTGDTVRISVSLRNILSQAATGLQFQAASLSGSLRLLSGPVSVGTLAPGAAVDLPPLVFVADTVTRSRVVPISLRWTYGASEQDAYPLSAKVFDAPPLWVLQDTPSNQNLFSVKAVNRLVIWAAGGDGSGTAPSVVRTTSGGKLWKDVTGNLAGEDLYCISAVDSLHAWVGTGKGHIYATADGGTTWNLQSYPGTQSPFINGVWFFNLNDGVALGDPVRGGTNTFIILKTANGGQTWAHVAHEPVGGSGEVSWNNSWWWIDPQHGWFGSNQNKVWRSVDGGASWLNAPTGGDNSVGVSFGDALHGVAVHDVGVASYTTDGGVTWNAAPHPSSTLNAVAFVPGSLIAWVIDAVGPFRTTDGGVTWKDETTFPFDGSLLHLSAADSGASWLTTSFGQALVHHAGPDTGVSIEPAPVPLTFALYQNYPNPFNPKTLISFNLPAAETARLAVYDILGREVGVLFDQAMGAGPHSVVFDGSQIASGIYFYRLQAGGRNAVGKMALVR